MTAPTSAPPYGGRFFDELRRLTNSTCGLTYADVSRVRMMTRDQVLAVLARRYDLDWMLRLDSGSPEEFARAIVREGPAMAKDPALAMEALLTVAQIVVPFD